MNCSVTTNRRSTFTAAGSAVKLGKEYDAHIIAANRCTQTAVIGNAMRDPAALDEAADCHEATASSMSSRVPSIRMSAALLRHQPAPALAFVSTAEAAGGAEDAAAFTAVTRLEGELERGHEPALASALEQYRAARAKRDLSSPDRTFYMAIAPTLSWPVEARALARLGRLDEAEALIARTPLDCYDCVRTRGLVAEARGDRRGAQLHYLAAAQLGPRLPAAFADWGRLLATAGRYGSAQVKLREAVRLAPNWADPLKSWGDLLAAQGKRAEARAKYDAALKLAPNWAALRDARARIAR